MTARITLAFGGESVLVDRAVFRAVHDVRKSEPQAQRITIGADRADAGAVIADAAAPTLFGDASILVVTGIDAATDDVDAALRAFADEPPEHVWLVVTHPGGVKGKNLLEYLRKAGAEQVDCAPLKRGRDTMDFVAKEFRSHKRSATPEAMQVLYDAVGQDLMMLAAAVSQLSSDVETNPIGADDVRAYFDGVADVSGFAIADAVWDRRSVDALRSLRYATKASDKIAVPTVVALANGLRSIVRVAAVGAGASEAVVAKEAGVPPFKVKALRRQWTSWSGDQRRLAAAAVALADADGALKGGVLEGSALDAEQKRLALERLVVMTAIPRRD